MTTGESITTAKTTFSPPTTVQRSIWHSPIPYLFGGLAAMLGVIALALLLLACSYLRRSGGGEANGNRVDDVEAGAAEKCERAAGADAQLVFEDKVLVIMAGEAKPTYIATPRDVSVSDEASESKGKDDEFIPDGKLDENKASHA